MGTSIAAPHDVASDTPVFQTVADLIQAWDISETWAPAAGHQKYDVSSWGRVRRAGVLLTPSCTDGYLFVSLSAGSSAFSSRVHVLVARTFLGKPPFEGAQVAHNDGNSRNNRVSNLRWASAVENQADRRRHGTRTIGSDVFGAKLSEADIPLVRQRITAGDRYSSIADDYGVSVSTISLIKLGRIWKHV